eukprot:m.62628 g.62628  ORF g.62628 m.62628 type:complete len:949 (-) comp9622_c0_seq2:2012-4858(-)
MAQAPSQRPIRTELYSLYPLATTVNSRRQRHGVASDRLRGPLQRHAAAIPSDPPLIQKSTTDPKTPKFEKRVCQPCVVTAGTGHLPTLRARATGPSPPKKIVSPMRGNGGNPTPLPRPDVGRREQVLVNGVKDGPPEGRSCIIRRRRFLVEKSVVAKPLPKHIKVMQWSLDGDNDVSDANRYSVYRNRSQRLRDSSIQNDLKSIRALWEYETSLPSPGQQPFRQAIRKDPLGHDELTENGAKTTHYFATSIPTTNPRCTQGQAESVKETRGINHTGHVQHRELGISSPLLRRSAPLHPRQSIGASSPIQPNTQLDSTTNLPTHVQDTPPLATSVPSPASTTSVPTPASTTEAPPQMLGSGTTADESPSRRRTSEVGTASCQNMKKEAEEIGEEDTDELKCTDGYRARLQPFLPNVESSPLAPAPNIQPESKTQFRFSSVAIRLLGKQSEGSGTETATTNSKWNACKSAFLDKCLQTISKSPNCEELKPRSITRRVTAVQGKINFSVAEAVRLVEFELREKKRSQQFRTSDSVFVTLDDELPQSNVKSVHRSIDPKATQILTPVAQRAENIESRPVDQTNKRRASRGRPSTARSTRDIEVHVPGSAMVDDTGSDSEAELPEHVGLSVKVHVTDLTISEGGNGPGEELAEPDEVDEANPTDDSKQGPSYSRRTPCTECPANPRQQEIPETQTQRSPEPEAPILSPKTVQPLQRFGRLRQLAPKVIPKARKILKIPRRQPKLSEIMYELDPDEASAADYLSRMCLLPDWKLESYRLVFSALDKENKDAISATHLCYGLQTVCGHDLKDIEIDFIAEVLDLLQDEGPNKSDTVNFKQFALAAALSETILGLDDAVRSRITLHELVAKKRKAMLMYFVDASEDCTLGVEDLGVLLDAGRVDEARKHLIMDRLEQNGDTITFMEYLAHLPLFLDLHEDMIENTFKETRRQFPTK